MNFNFVKNNGFFEKNQSQIEVDDYMSMYSTQASLNGQEMTMPKKSEDGWNKSLGSKRLSKFNQVNNNLTQNGF